MGISAFGASGIKHGVCTSTTRPSAPYEGMMIYETDTDLLRIWNGSAWRTLAFGTPTNGAVLQVVSNQITTQTATTSTSFVDATDFNATITPTSTASKVFVTVSAGTGHAAATGGFLRLLRNGTVIGADPQVWFYTGSTDSLYSGVQNTFTYLDSPSSTSALTYKVQFRGENASGVSINRAYSGVGGQVMASTITLMEIAG